MKPNTKIIRPLIGITAQISKNTMSWTAPVISQNRQYPDAVMGAGGIPVIIPIIETNADLRNLYDRFDGILFAGGGDIDPSEYSEEAGPVLKDVSTERDKLELQLIKWAIADGKPILAICRGLQILNVALGGNLIQDIPSQVEGAENHDISTEKQNRHYLAHSLAIDPDSKLAAIIGTTEIKTNTHHHQAIKKLAPGLLIAGRAADGIIEAVELAGNRSEDFAIGVQSHPESLVRTDPSWQKLFVAFVAACSAYSLANPFNSFNSKTSEAFEEV